MNYTEITHHLASHGYSVSAVEVEKYRSLRIPLTIAGQEFVLVHIMVTELNMMPAFFLEDPLKYGRLAHVMVDDAFLNLGYICVNVADSVSVNFERPELAFLEALKRTEALIHHAVEDPDWNRSELLREFQAGWARIADDDEKKLLCLSNDGTLEILQIHKPVKKGSAGISTMYFGLPEGSTADMESYSFVGTQVAKRERSPGRGYVIPLTTLEPAPWCKEALQAWYARCIDNLPMHTKNTLIDKNGQWRAHEFWLVFNADTPSGKTWFCLYLSLKNGQSGKKRLPLTNEDLTIWDLSALEVSLFNKERLMPRSGANYALRDKKVLLIGCGSVGCEIADKMAATGIGTLDMSDPDTFSLDNMFRHSLSLDFVGFSKTTGLACQLSRKYPWLKTQGLYNSTLLKFRDKQILEKYDLIIIAIGAPTHERLFHEYLHREGIKTPVINSWVEGFGVGGHAVIDIPSSPGCMSCAYVDIENMSRGLSSNLNFLKDNQNITRNHAGCGTAFLPYNFITSTQTALVAAMLATRYLQGDLQVSSRICWKGDAADAVSEGFEMTERFHAFTRSLQVIPLYNECCDRCND
ncbi:ThiF family adenylyltransferase [Serratia sp. S4]|uniref:ThiF family adenylyltransferase n=1 Tax=Serratia sp. S4 TaxID=768491 RepID=UPI00035E0B64|nr:ThiF family adenylyltransferase [Serratia sp. S4]